MPSHDGKHEILPEFPERARPHSEVPGRKLRELGEDSIASQTEGAGSASGLLGVTSFVFGAATSPIVGLGGAGTSLPMAVVAVASGLLVLFFFRMAGKARRASRRP